MKTPTSKKGFHNLADKFRIQWFRNDSKLKWYTNEENSQCCPASVLFYNTQLRYSADLKEFHKQCATQSWSSVFLALWCVCKSLYVRAERGKSEEESEGGKEKCR